MSLRLLPLLGVLAIAGCTSAPRQAAVSVPFTGTWHQASTATTAEPLGFLAIDGERVLFNLDGLPRGLVAISDNATNAGLRSGRLACADGRTLYLAVGDSLTIREAAEGRLLTPTLHLDVQVFAPGAGPGDAPQKVLRLWPSAALAVAALPTNSRPIPGAAASATQSEAAPSGSTTDQRFTATIERLSDPLLAGIAPRLTRAHTEGLSVTGLDHIYRRSTLVVRAEVLHDFDAARRGDRTALARADDRLGQLAEANRAYAEWLDRR